MKGEAIWPQEAGRFHKKWLAYVKDEREKERASQASR